MSETPELRAGPPWAMEEMIAAEPGLVEPVLADPDLLRREEEPYRRAAEVAEAGYSSPAGHVS